MEKNPSDESSMSLKDPSSTIPQPENSILLNKSLSFQVKKDRPKSRPLRRALSCVDQASSHRPNNNVGENEEDQPENNRQPTLDEISHEIDAFIDKLSSFSDNNNDNNVPEIPKSIETFATMIQSEIDKYDSGDSPLTFGQDSTQDTLVINGISRMSKLIKLLENLPSDKEVISSSLMLMTLVLQRTMSIMEEDFRVLLEDSMNPPPPNDSTNKEAEPTESSDEQKPTEGKDEVKDDNMYPRGINQEIRTSMRMIASSMISSGYEIECRLVFVNLRRIAFQKEIKEQGMEKVSMDEVQKMQWDALEGHISTWVKVVKKLTQVLLPGQKRLYEFIFSSHPLIVEEMITSLVRSVAILFFTFAEAIAMTKRSAERLFKVLDVYDALTELNSSIEGSLGSSETANELVSDSSAVKRRLGDAAVCIFCDLENSIKNDAARTPVPNGAVHPLTRYTMNYLRYACDFKNTLQEVFSLHEMTEQRLGRLEPKRDNEKNSNNESSSVGQSPFALELVTIMNLLDANLEEKSKLYKDPSLRYIFLMNNGRYILQKIKESSEIHQVVDDDFRRRKSSELRGYHKSYQRETWGRALQCLNQEGLQVNGKVQKPVLKERFKSFNQIFDEIQKTQSSWVVSDGQLQSELQVSISAVMIPAYRSFLGRFGQIFYPGRQYEKYVKFQPEDIESAIEGLFDGHQNLSMARRK